MVPSAFGGDPMAATANTTIQLAVPDRPARPGHERLHDVFVGSTPIGGLLMGGLASRLGILRWPIALGGVLSLGAGVGAFAWGRGRAIAAPTRAAAIVAADVGRPRRVRRDRAGRLRPSVHRAEDERRVEPAEPERGRQHPPVGARRGPRAAAPAAAPPTPGSGSTRLTDAGAQPSRIASAQIAASIAPDAPSGWPYSAFVPLTGTVAARSPSASAIARASATSPIGVDEAWALT